MDQSDLSQEDLTLKKKNTITKPKRKTPSPKKVALKKSIDHK